MCGCAVLSPEQQLHAVVPTRQAITLTCAYVYEVQTVTLTGFGGGNFSVAVGGSATGVSLSSNASDAEFRAALPASVNGCSGLSVTRTSSVSCCAAR